MSSNKIRDLASSLATYAADQERMATPLLVNALSKSLKEYPHDQTIGGVLRVLESMVANNKIFIRKAELKDLYKRYYTNHTKFAQAVEEHMGDISYQPAIQEMPHDDSADIDIYAGADDMLTNALSNAFDATVPLKGYSEKVASSVKNSVAMTLESWNVAPGRLSVDAGNEKFIVIKADYETPKGLTSIYVPVDVSKNKIAQPSVFVGNFGPEELNNQNIKKYVTKHAGTKLTVASSLILDVLVKSSSENTEITSAEMAVIKLKAAKQAKNEFYGNQVLAQQLAEPVVADVQYMKFDETASFEEKFATASGQAAWQFGTDKLKIASDAIARNLISLGHKNYQIAISGNNENTVFYSVALNSGKVAFNVPVKIKEGKVSAPKVLICNGSISSFNAESINKLVTENLSDTRASVTASPLFGLKPSDVLQNLRAAMTEGNMAKAEDALNVLAGSGDEKAYASGFSIYMGGLNKSASAQEPESQCSRMMKSSASQHMICSHTNLPVHKVYQDQHGNCRPLFRKGMDETYEAASFMNSKIFG